MRIKQFLKPTISKVIFFIFLFLVFPSPFLMGKTCACPPGVFCNAMPCYYEWQIIPFGGLNSVYVLYNQIYNTYLRIVADGEFLIDWKPLKPLGVTIPYLIIFPYLFSCLTISIWNKLRNRK